MDQRLSAEQFVDSYQVIRKLYHFRLVKLEKMKDLSNHMQNTEVKPPPHCCCLWPQSEVHDLCSCVGSAMTLPHVHYPLATYLVKTPYLPPLDYHLCHNYLWKPTGTPLDSRHPEGPRVCGQPSRWPARPRRLQRLHQQPKNNQRDPKC